MKIAVTGANGHVGVNLCKALINQGHEVTALTHTHISFLKDIKVRQQKGDVLDPESLGILLKDADAVFHLAARISIKGDEDGSVWQVNAEGTRNMVEAAVQNKVKKFIHFSSIHAFEQNPQDLKLDENRPLVTTSGFAYDRSKAEGERIVKEASRNGLDAVIVSPTAILGPDDPEPSLTGKAVLQLYYRKVPSLVPGGYNWVDVRDVIQGAISAMERGRKGEKYLLSGTYCSLPDLSKLISTIGNVKTPGIVVPFWLAHAGLPFVTAYSKISGTEPLYTRESLVIIKEGSKHITNEKARKELGFDTRPLETTLEDFIAYFRQTGFIK
jgi:dihydroflavonol-4-reductase